MRDSNFVFDSKICRPELVDGLRRMHAMSAGSTGKFAEIFDVEDGLREKYLQQDTRFSFFSALNGGLAFELSANHERCRLAAEKFFANDFSFCLNSVHLFFVQTHPSSDSVPVLNYLCHEKTFEAVSSVRSVELDKLCQPPQDAVCVFVMVNALRLSAVGGASCYRRLTLQIGAALESMRAADELSAFELKFLSDISDSRLLHTLNLSPRVFLPFGVLMASSV